VSLLGWSASRVPPLARADRGLLLLPSLGIMPAVPNSSPAFRVRLSPLSRWRAASPPPEARSATPWPPVKPPPPW